MPRGYSANNQRSGQTIDERLAFYSDRTGGYDSCWLWSGARSSGYGSIKINGVTHRAHKVCWERRHGPVPDGFVLRHRCDNPPCINPACMKIGTDAENAADKVERQRAARGEGNGNAVVATPAVLQIRASNEKAALLAGRFDISPSNVSRIRRGETWQHLLPEGTSNSPLPDAPKQEDADEET